MNQLISHGNELYKYDSQRRIMVGSPSFKKDQNSPTGFRISMS